MTKTIILSVVSVILLFSISLAFTLPQASAIPGDLIFEINNPTPASNDDMGIHGASTPNGDILTGAFFDDTGATDAGIAYLFDGATGGLILTINNPTPAAGDRFGAFFASTPNGDIITSSDLDNSVGTAYLFDGTATGTTSIPILTINNPTPENGDRFGGNLASTPNGDIIVGAPGDNTGATNAGSVYLFDGTTGALLLTINNPAAETNDFFGDRVASTPDGNIIVGVAQDNPNNVQFAGSAYLFDGTTGELLLTINKPNLTSFDLFGESVASTPNGDIIVGAHREDTGATDTGSAYLFDGITGDLLLTINNPTPEPGEEFGEFVSSTSSGQIIVKAKDNTGAPRAGSVYLFDGITGELILTINNPYPATDDAFGSFAIANPDDDIIIGAFLDDVGATNAGSVYLFEGPISNSPPTANIGGPYSGNEGSSITFDGSASTDDNGITLYEWDLDYDGITFDIDQSSVSSTVIVPFDDDVALRDIALRVTDTNLETDIATTTLTVDNVDPSVGVITTTMDPQEVGTPIIANVDFTDDGTLDTHTVTIDWGDGKVDDCPSDCTLTQGAGSGSIDGSHTYTTSGIFTITITVTDDDTGSGDSFFQFIAIYDPAEGFVTGQGRIDSPVGAYILDLGVSGEAKFGFNSKYEQGANVPTGHTQFKFKVADLHFSSDVYDWLVVAGSQAKFKGTGTINDAGNYGFQVFGFDSDLNQNDNSFIDKFRIKIWDKDAGDTVVYDNQMGASDDADPDDTTEITKGNIKIHN